MVPGLFNPLSSLFIGMMKQDGRHSPEEAIPIVNGEVTEPSSPGVVGPIVSGLFNLLSSLFIGMMKQDGGHSAE